MTNEIVFMTGGGLLLILNLQLHATEDPHLIAVITIRFLLEEDTVGLFPQGREDTVEKGHSHIHQAHSPVRTRSRNRSLSHNRSRSPYLVHYSREPGKDGSSSSQRRKAWKFSFMFYL
ncbi:unnamed protein product [Fraxinus pennsylvanica]|uniref:Secreted protein n=1 Tax=Fraxinus pennsylvanica TaxID=56036 RepID=A0AAD1Z238_9LAMI|nr:unnamed protein product [Fraxinus pennsylvanica]